MCKLGDICVPRQGGLADSVSLTLWVYGHKAWVNTLAIKPGWLGVVYQGQLDSSDATMQKNCD